MSDNPWKCAGCGKPSPDMLRNCDCPTSVLYRTGERGTVWKIEPGSKEDWERRAQTAELQLSRLVEKTAAELHHIMRAAEMSAGIMLDKRRTGNWAGAQRTADAFDRIGLRAAKAKAALLAKLKEAGK